MWGCLHIDREVDIEMRDIPQSPSKQLSDPRLQPLSNIIDSSPPSRVSSPRSVVEIEKIVLERKEDL